MLLDNDLPPERSVYYIGAKVIEVLIDEPFDRVDMDAAFGRLNKDISEHKAVPFAYFILSLDWLFLLGLIDVTEQGDIVRCF